mgnify:CR=1 FL=1
MHWKTIEKVSSECGLSKESLRALKKKGVLRERVHWVKAPNGRILINAPALEKWMTAGI